MQTTWGTHTVIGALVIAGAVTGAAAQTAAPAVTVITNATIFTVSGAVIERGSVLIRNGRIAAVGPQVDVPRGAVEIDGTGRFVTPGIIDAHSHIAIDGSVNEGSMSVTSMVGTEDVLDPLDVDLYRGLAGGVTTANILHGSANAIGGKNAVIKLRWGRDARGLLFEGAPPGIKFALGENPKRSNRSGSATEARYPTTRMGVIDVVREAFVQARDYQARQRRHEAAVKAGDRSSIAPARDLTLEPLVEILEGRRLVHAHCYRADEILQLLRVAEEFNFKIATLQHVLEGYKVADEIARHGAGASTFSDWWAYKVEAFDAIPYNAALMAERGVLVSINSDSAEEHRHLNQEAAKAIKYGGMSEAEALKLVTLNPARQLGIDKRVGSIDVGKDADLVLFNAHPLSVYAVPELVLIDGQVYFDRTKDLEQRKTREQRRLTLQQKQAPGDRPRPAGADTAPRQTTPQAQESPR
jgi:imidazolonepropionase-like amidohydrolase